MSDCVPLLSSKCLCIHLLLMILYTCHETVFIPNLCEGLLHYGRNSKLPVHPEEVSYPLLPRRTCFRLVVLLLIYVSMTLESTCWKPFQPSVSAGNVVQLLTSKMEIYVEC